MTDIALQLDPDVELLVGANDTPMLFLPSAGRYVQMTKNGSRLLPLLDGTRTGEQLVTELSTQYRTAPATVRPVVLRFLTDLKQAEVLNLSSERPQGRKRALEAVRRLPLLRLPLTHSVNRVLAPLAQGLRSVPARPGVAFVVLAVLAAAVTAVVTAFQLGVPRPAGVNWVVVVAALLVTVLLHEGAHAFVCQLLGVPAREAGIGLLLYVIPVAYVDRTDAYRLRRRGGRVAIALAGAASDLIWAAVAAVIASSSSGSVAATAHLFLVIQLISVLANLNLLLPSDGHQAIEAAVGELNIRGRAIGYLGHLVLRIPLPSGLAYVSRRRGALYIGYGVLCLTYFALLLFSVLVTVVSLLVGLF